jgi:hypothetical protein
MLFRRLLDLIAGSARGGAANADRGFVCALVVPGGGRSAFWIITVGWTLSKL